MTGLRAETERLLAVDPRKSSCPTERLCKHAQCMGIAPALFDHLRALQAENDRLQAECEALRRKAGAFRNRLVSALAELEEGGYEVRRAWAELKANEFEEAFDAAMNRERGG